jgi:hypothetical protein
MAYIFFLLISPPRQDGPTKIFFTKEVLFCLHCNTFFSAVPGVGHSAQYQQCQQAHTDPPQAGDKKKTLV